MGSCSLGQVLRPCFVGLPFPPWLRPEPMRASAPLRTCVQVIDRGCVQSLCLPLVVQVIDLEDVAADAPAPAAPNGANGAPAGPSEAKKELAEAKWKPPAGPGPAGAAPGRPLDDYAQLGVLTATKTPAGICM